MRRDPANITSVFFPLYAADLILIRTDGLESKPRHPFDTADVPYQKYTLSHDFGEDGQEELRQTLPCTCVISL